MTDKEINQFFNEFRTLMISNSIASNSRDLIVNKFDLIISKLSIIDIVDIKSKYDELSPILNDESIDNAKLEYLCELETSIAEYEYYKKEMTNILLTAIALNAFTKNISRDDIIQIYRNENDSIKNDILIRLSWIKNHQEILNLGQKVANPFLCLVPDPSIRKNSDREFYSILYFVSSNQFFKENDFLFYCYYSQDKQPPDFSLLNSNGELLGVEVTEAAINSQYYSERDAYESISKLLTSHFNTYPLTLHIWRRPRWNIINKNPGNLISWLQDIFTAFLGSSETKVIHTFNDLNIRIELRKNSDRLLILDGCPSIPNLEYGSLCYDLFSDQVVNRIKSKLSRNQPNIRPCILLIYLTGNTIYMQDIDRFISITHSKIDFDISSHFDNVWILIGEKAFKLI